MLNLCTYVQDCTHWQIFVAILAKTCLIETACRKRKKSAKITRKVTTNLIGTIKHPDEYRKNKSFSFTWSAALQIAWNKRKFYFNNMWKKFNSHRIFFINKYDRRDVMWKRSITRITNFRKNCKSNKSFHCNKKNALTNIESIPRITNLAKVNEGKEGPLMGKFVILAILAIFVSQSF